MQGPAKKAAEIDSAAAAGATNTACTVLFSFKIVGNHPFRIHVEIRTTPQLRHRIGLCTCRQKWWRSLQRLSIIVTYRTTVRSLFRQQSPTDSELAASQARSSSNMVSASPSTSTVSELGSASAGRWQQQCVSGSV